MVARSCDDVDFVPWADALPGTLRTEVSSRLDTSSDTECSEFIDAGHANAFGGRGQVQWQVRRVGD